MQNKLLNRVIIYQGFLKRLIRINTKYIIFYLFFPLIFFIAPVLNNFNLIKLSDYTLNFSNFKIYQIFTTILVHVNIKTGVFDYNHLMSNLVGYYLLGFLTICFISEFSKKQKINFYTNLFFILPVINFIFHSVVVVGIYKITKIYFSGFSLILLALFSFILLSIIEILTKHHKLAMWVLFFDITVLMCLIPKLFIIPNINLGHITGYLFGIYLYLRFNNKKG